MASVSITQSDAQVVLRSFLLTILPFGVDVIEGQDNRVPEPKVEDFIVYWPLRRVRLATNIDSSGDVSFEGSISQSVLNVTSVISGVIVIGALLFGVNVTDGTKIIGFLTGTGSVGTYTISPSQSVTQSVLSTGIIGMMQETELVMQLDVHGPASSDNVQIVSTAFRDQYATGFFATYPGITPLYMSDPIQAPFLNDQHQIENRWSVDAHIQIDPNVSVPQQYADAAVVGLIEVDATYPP